MPESSAIAGRPVAAAAARALMSALAAYVSPSSGGVSTSSGSGSSVTAGSSRSNSRSLWALRVASSSRTAVYRTAAAWISRSCFDAVLRERQQVVQVRARERGALGGRLDLDEPAVAGHDHVGVDLRRGVLGIVQVEQRDAVDDPARHGGDAAGERRAGEATVLHQLADGELERDVAAGDRGAAGAAVGLQDVAVDVDGALAERREVDHPAQRAADQALDLDRAAVGAALRHVALLAVAGRRGQHPVLGRDPAAALAHQPARDRLLGRGGADHARLAARDQRRAGGGPDEAGLDRGGPQRVGRAPPAPLAHRPPPTSSRSPSASGSTSASGSCRKRVPRARKAWVSPVHRNE